MDGFLYDMALITSMCMAPDFTLLLNGTLFHAVTSYDKNHHELHWINVF